MHTGKHAGCNILAVLPLLLTVLLLQSCSDWLWESGGDCPGDDQNNDVAAVLNLEMEIHTPSAQRRKPTRGLRPGDDRENVIAEVAVLLFLADANGQPTEMLDCLEPYLLLQDENQPELYHAAFAKVLDGTLRNRDLRVCVLANGKHLLPKIEEAQGQKPKGNLTYGEIEALVHTVLTTDEGEIENRREPATPTRDIDGMQGFTMWGLPFDIIKVKGETSVAIECCLMRDLARFDVRLGEELRQSGLFDFRSVHFYRPSTTVMHFPQTGGIEHTVDEVGHPYHYATAPTLHPDNGIYWRWDYEESVEDGVFTKKCYVPEGEVIMQGRNGGAGKPRDINHTNRPAVIVGGYYNGSSEMSYYRIDVCNEEGNLVEILRNHLYDITIRSVLGPGQPTPDEAYDNNAIKIVAQITDWCMVDRDVMYNGADWITVSKRVINLTGNAGAGTTFVINSSVPLDEWEFKLGEDTDFTTGTLIQSDTFFVTRPIQEVDSKILVVTQHDLEPGNEPVSERLYVRIGGRVLFYITIVQHPLQGDYWFLGDYFPGDRGPWQAVINFPIGGKDPSIPPDNFMEFLKWLFGDKFSGSVGEGDNISESEYLNGFFWQFLTWFFTDPYGHIIGGTMDEWNEDWHNPIAAIVFNLFKWMLGDNYYREIEGPDTEPYDPEHPKYSTVGPAMAMEFMDWFKILDYIREIDGPGDQPYDPSKPNYTTVGAETMKNFLAWMKNNDYFDDLSSWRPNEGDDPDSVGSRVIDLVWKALEWCLSSNFSGELGEEPEPDHPDQPVTPTNPPISVDTEPIDWNQNTEEKPLDGGSNGIVGNDPF